MIYRLYHFEVETLNIDGLNPHLQKMKGKVQGLLQSAVVK